jgi:hypothetical protein
MKCAPRLSGRELPHHLKGLHAIRLTSGHRLRQIPLMRALHALHSFRPAAAIIVRRPCVTQRFHPTSERPRRSGMIPPIRRTCERRGIMRYQISGKQIDVGEALQTHVKAELGEVVEKYAQRPTECVVVFSRSAHEYVCEAVDPPVHRSDGAGQGPCDRDLRGLRILPREDGQAAAPLQAPHPQPPQRTAGPVEFGGASSYILAANRGAEDTTPTACSPS